MRQLDDLEQDALKEILNIGVGYAADSFSRLIGSPVRLSLPELKLIYDKSLVEAMFVADTDIASIVKQSFRGTFAADAVFLFPGNSSLELVRLMVGKDMPVEEMRELEQDALVEVGNILFNSCVSVISDTLGIPFECGMPRFEAGRLEELLAEFQPQSDCLILMNIGFAVEQVRIHGYIMFIMKVESMEVFLAAIKKYLGLSI